MSSSSTIIPYIGTDSYGFTYINGFVELSAIFEVQK